MSTSLPIPETRFQKNSGSLNAKMLHPAPMRSLGPGSYLWRKGPLRFVQMSQSCTFHKSGQAIFFVAIEQPLPQSGAESCAWPVRMKVDGLGSLVRVQRGCQGYMAQVTNGCARPCVGRHGSAIAPRSVVVPVMLITNGGRIGTVPGRWGNWT